jgi:hypothetical protein
MFASIPCVCQEEVLDDQLMIDISGAVILVTSL